MDLQFRSETLKSIKVQQSKKKGNFLIQTLCVYDDFHLDAGHDFIEINPWLKQKKAVIACIYRQWFWKSYS